MIEALLALLGELYFFLGYFSGKASFPIPLNQAQEQEALLQLKEGSEEAKEKLIVHNLRLVAHVAKKYIGSGIEQDDLISIGAYKKGANPALDKAIAKIDGINSFLQQEVGEKFEYDDTVSQMKQAISD